MRVPEPERRAQYLRQTAWNPISVSAFPRHMKCIVRLLTAVVAMWAASGHAQTVFPISENDVDASGTVLMCPKSNIYAPCRDTGSLPLPVEFGGALNFFCPVIARRRKPMLTRLALRKPMLVRWLPR